MTKEYISEQIKKRMDERNLSMKRLSDQIDGVGAAQVYRVVKGENYNIETLLKIMKCLDLKLTIASE